MVPTARKPTLRRLIEEVLRTDAELIGFCVDYFPAVSVRFGDGQDRLAKTTLLLQIVPRARLLQALREHEPECFVAAMVLLGLDEASLLRCPLGVPRMHWAQLPWVIFGGGMAVFLSLLGNFPTLRPWIPAPPTQTAVVDLGTRSVDAAAHLASAAASTLKSTANHGTRHGRLVVHTYDGAKVQVDQQSPVVVHSEDGEMSAVLMVNVSQGEHRVRCFPAPEGATPIAKRIYVSENKKQFVDCHYDR